MRTYLPLLLVAVCAMSWGGTISGRVFLDANDDGLYQATEEAVTGALVSDGLTIVASGTDGRYRLESPDGEQVVFVVNPSGTWFPRGFSRLVQVGPAEADFPLVRQEQKLPFCFVQGTDLHIRPEIADKMARYVAAVNALPLPVAFVVHTGDLVVDSTMATSAAYARDLFAKYKEMVAGLKPPLINLPGNHEHVSVGRPEVSPDSPGWGKATYRELFGPMYFAFNYAGVSFLALDGTDIVNGKGVYGIPAQCLAWVKAYLDRLPMDARLVLLIHEPIISLPQRAELEKMLQGRKVVVGLCGHGHGIAYWPFAGTTEIMGGTTSYAWHGSGYGPNPLGYHVVRITDTGYEDAFGDWATRYSIAVRQPQRTSTLTAGVRVEGQILDPAGEVRSLELRWGTSQSTVTSFATQGLARTFSADLDAADLPEGFHDLTLTANGKGEPEVERQPFLVLSGKAEPVTLDQPVTLRLRLRNVNAADVVTVNGKEVGKADPAQKGQTLSLQVAPADLKRLNLVEVTAARAADGTWDQFEVDGVEMLSGGKSTYDYRRGKYSVLQVRTAGTQPGKGSWYLDLLRPDDYAQ